MYRKLMLLTFRLENNKVIEAVKQGFLMVLPLIMAGAFALVLRYMPLPAVQDWLAHGIGSEAAIFLESVHQITTGYLAIYLTVCISYVYSKNFSGHQWLLRVIAILLALVCVIASLGAGNPSFSFDSFGPTGVFTAMAVSVCSVRLYFFLYQSIVGSEEHPREIPGDLSIRHLFRMLFPFLICGAIFSLLNRFLYLSWGFLGINDLIARCFSALLIPFGNSVGGGIVLMLLESFLWFFGIHGANAMEHAVQITFPAANAGVDFVMSKTFTDIFCLMGGCGTSICLMLALLFFSKSRRNRSLLKSVVVPIVFNINEPLVFGLPIVFNPILLLPFMTVPVVSLLIAYGAVQLGIMPASISEVTWTTPVLLSGYLATGSFGGAMVQVCSIIVGTLIYAPFVRLLEEMPMEEAEEVFAREMERLYLDSLDTGEELSLIHGHNSVTTAGSAIVEMMQEGITAGHMAICYQPQMTADEEVYGAEALLRLPYGTDHLMPSLALQLAREAGIADTFTYAIVRQVCEDIADLRRRDMGWLRMSVNVSAEQMNCNEFVDRVLAMANQYAVCDRLCLEITEEMSLNGMEHAAANMKRLEEAGILVSMDDFGMGHTFLTNLQEHHFSHVKLDGELVRNMVKNDRSRKIAASLISLGKELGFEVVAEFVDSREKKDMLVQMGCDYFQGYLYSPAIPLEEFAAFVRNHERECYDAGY